MPFGDRLKRAFQAIARGAEPRLDYGGFYRAKVVSHSDGMVHVVPDDRRLPRGMVVPLRTGIPGAKVTLRSGHYVLVGFDNWDPEQSFACLWDNGEGAPVDLTLKADKVVVDASQVELAGTGGKKLLTEDLLPLIRDHFHPASSGTTSPSVQLTQLALDAVPGVKTSKTTAS